MHRAPNTKTLVGIIYCVTSNCECVRSIRSLYFVVNVVRLNLLLFGVIMECKTVGFPVFQIQMPELTPLACYK